MDYETFILLGVKWLCRSKGWEGGGRVGVNIVVGPVASACHNTHVIHHAWGS